MASSIHLNWYIGNIWKNNILHKANQTLMYMYTYLWRKRSWQIETEWVAMQSQTHNKVYIIKTNKPIVKNRVVFYCWKMEVIDHWIDDDIVYTCDCVSHISRPSCWCQEYWKSIDLKQVWPWTPLQPWTYKISWWSYSWWLQGNTIEFMLPMWWCCEPNCDSVFVSYYAWPLMMKCINDEIPLPEAYMYAYGLIFEWLLGIELRDTQSLKENILITMWKEIIEWLDFEENNVPTYFQPLMK